VVLVEKMNLTRKGSRLGYSADLG